MKDFKIGDRVRVIDAPCPEWMQNMPALPDAIFKVEGTQNDKLILSMECSDARFIVDAEHFELVETPEQNKNMGDLSSEPIREAESYLVNQAFCDSYIRATSKCFDIKGEIKDYDLKNAFLTELQALMKRYNATIDVDGDECALWLTIDIDGHAIEYTVYDYFTDKKKQTALTPDNIFNYEKE